ncbi:unnamed protein product [Pleuronectes platessa]|uniref:Interleukin-18 n=1 Tax=Pleuronectes platessa TaxID=8262 RepID=A0A9N7ZC36_PLEPL|nr:unnamed protein product [Pleuronectes platessa]
MDQRYVWRVKASLMTRRIPSPQSSMEKLISLHLYRSMMAANDCSPITFYGTCNDAFYFDVLDGDGFTDSGESHTYNLRCKDNKILLLNATDQFQLEHLRTQEHCRPECKFNIRTYDDSSEEVGPGVPVMLYANKNGKKLVACCKENNEICTEAMVLPIEIMDNAHKALFYLTQLTANKFMFESTVYRSKFLGFTCVDGNPSLKKLVLRSKGPDGVDESSEATLNECTE